MKSTVKFISLSATMGLALASTSFAQTIANIAPLKQSPSGLIRIYGSGFGSGTDSGALIDGQPAPIASWTDGLIECYVPAGTRPGWSQIRLKGNGIGTKPIPFQIIRSTPTSGRAAWRFKAADQYISARPAVGPDGTIYAVGNFGHLYALTPSGSLKWVKQGVASNATVDVLPSGNIVCGGSGGVMSFTPEGLSRWSFPITTALGAGPNVGPDGLIYLIDNLRWGNDIRGMIILNDSGNLVWNGGVFYKRGANFNPAEIVFGGGKAYVWSDGAVSPQQSDLGLVAVNLGGGLAWSDVLGVGIQQSASPSPNVAYCTTTSVTMRSANGNLIWSAPLAAQPQQIVVTSSDGSTYLATGNARLNGWTSNGTPKFSTFTGGLLNWLAVSPNGQNVVVQMADFVNPAQVQSYSPSGVQQWTFALPVEFGMNISVYSYMKFIQNGTKVVFGTAGPYTGQFEAHCYVYALNAQ